MIKSSIVLLLFVPILLIATPNDLASKIANLQNAPKSQRFKLMNEIKREMAQMNANQRNKTLEKLHASKHKKNITGTNKENMRHKIHQHQETMHNHDKPSTMKVKQDNHQNPSQKKQHPNQSNSQHDQ